MFKEIVKAQLNRAESDEESISTLGSFGTVFSYKDAVLGTVGDGNTAIGKRGLPPRNNKTSMSNIRSNNNNNSSNSITKNMTDDYMDQLPNAMANLKSSYSVEVPPSIFKIKSDIENIGLNIRCGHAESKNDCKSMEDFVFLSPTFNNSGSTTEQDDELVDEDFAFCAVYDGHGGDYVSRYLKDNLYIRFCEQFEDNSKCTDIDNGSSGPASSGMDKLDLVRISFKEAACKIDREVLLKDSRELMKMSNFRNDALSDCCSESTRETEVMDDSSTVYNRQAARSAASSSECFAGSCAVVAILYHSKSTIPSVPNSSITNSLSPQIAPQNSSNSLTPSALKLHSNDSPVMTAMFRNNLLGSRTRNVRRISTMSSSEAGDDYLMPFDVDNDKSLNRGTSHQSLEILRAMKRRSSVHSMLSDLTADRSFFRAESFLRQDSFPRQDGSVNCDDSGYISVKLTPKQIQLLKSLGDDSSTILSNFEMDDIQELANDLKSRAGEFQKYADDYRNHADALFQVINEHESTCNRDGDNFPLRKMKSDDSDDISSLGNPESRSSSSRVSMTSRSSVSGGSVGSVGSITSLKSFGDGDMGGGRRGKNYPALSTVSEGINESRQTSFATTRIASQESYIATTSPGQAWSQSTCNAVDQLELSETKNFLFIAHVGDCRAVLCDKSVAILLTEDHTPTQQDEVTRIKASGGFVSKKRVNGMLAVSRAFGDIKYKSFDPNVAAPESFLDEELLSTGIWSRSNTVISMPDILELEIQPTYEFIILASDGIWNVFSCAEAVQFVRDHLSEHENAMAAAKALIDQATVEGATDNASAVVICLNQT